MTDHSGRIVLVTGASRGIGYAAAKQLAANGAHVIAVARTQGGLEDLDDEIKSAGGQCTLVPMDLKDGDIIPIEMPEYITVFIEDLPTYRAKLGRCRDNIALQIAEKIKRPESVKSELTILTKGGKRLDSDAELHLLEDDL